jgi:hypothetical protein
MHVRTLQCGLRSGWFETTYHWSSWAYNTSHADKHVAKAWISFRYLSSYNRGPTLKCMDVHKKIFWDTLYQRFPNFFQVGTSFISQNVLRTAHSCPLLKANCLRFSTTVCDKQFTLIWFFLSFFGLMFNLRGPQGQNPRTTVWETLY